MLRVKNDKNSEAYFDFETCKILKQKERKKATGATGGVLKKEHLHGDGFNHSVRDCADFGVMFSNITF